jgi:hypothetical protein
MSCKGNEYVTFGKSDFTLSVYCPPDTIFVLIIFTALESNWLAETLNDGYDDESSVAPDRLLDRLLVMGIIPLFNTCRFIDGGAGGGGGRGGPVRIGNGVFTDVYPITGSAFVVIR